MTKCKTCGEENPAEIHTCTPGLYMNKDIIKAYIEYAIGNGLNKYTRFSDGFEVKKSLYKKEEWLGILLNNNLLEIIQSKEFIEAIARGRLKTKYKEIDFTQGDGEILLNMEIYHITIEQAIIIRENKLEDYIKEFLKH